MFCDLKFQKKLVDREMLLVAFLSRRLQIKVKLKKSRPPEQQKTLELGINNVWSIEREKKKYNPDLEKHLLVCF